MHAGLEAYEFIQNWSGVAGFDPMPVIRNLSIPGIWLYGELDRSIPMRLDVQNLSTLAAAGKPFEVIVYPFANHGLNDTRNGQRYDLWSDLLTFMRGIGALD